MNDYFEKILQAKVYEVAKKTPLDKANILSNSLNNEIYLKYVLCLMAFFLLLHRLQLEVFFQNNHSYIYF